MEKFRIYYQGQAIEVEKDTHYRLYFPDGSQLLMRQYPDDTSTTPVENYNISYSNSLIWAIEDKTEAPAWIDYKQLQVLGDLLKRKEEDLQSPLLNQ